MIFVFLCLTYFTSYDDLQVTLPQTAPFLFDGCVVFHCVCVARLYPSSAHGRLGCFSVLSVVNSAAVTTGVCVSSQLEFSLDTRPQVGLLDHVIALFFVFLRNLRPVFTRGCAALAYFLQLLLS